MRVALAVALLVALCPVRARSAVHEYRVLELPDGTALEHALVLPEGFSPDGTYPTLLALPPGRQDRAMVETGLARWWGDAAARRGWIVVSPVAPEGETFTTGAERLLPALLDVVAARYRVEGGRFHLAGASEGGLSAFRLARLHPDRFCSLVALPGGPPAPADEHRLAELARMPVRLFVGGEDTAFLVLARRTEAALRALGADVRADVLPGEGHAPRSLEGERVMDVLEGLRRELGLAGAAAPEVAPSAPPGWLAEDPVEAVGRLLDGFHAAAARADEAAYFDSFAPGAVFLGTDPSERWTVASFRRYAHARFAAGQGWTYVPEERHVQVDDDRRVAWFDELLRNDKYGRCRGTGVAVRRDGRWLVAQYSLTFTVPNDAAADVVGAIRRAEGRTGP